MENKWFMGLYLSLTDSPLFQTHNIYSQFNCRSKINQSVAQMNIFKISSRFTVVTNKIHIQKKNTLYI